MRVVVTRASGNVGTALLREVPDAGWQVVGVARRRPAQVDPYARATWATVDLGDPVAMEPLVELMAGADAVVHLAWAIDPRVDEPPMRRTNLVGTQTVLRAVATAGVPHLVCASSVAAYRPAPRWRRVAETAPVGGIAGSAYSRQKATLERMLDTFERTHPRVALARIRPCAVVSAAAGAQLRSWLIGPLLRTGRIARPVLPMPAWRGLRFQLVHAADVADAIRRIVEAGATGAFNLSTEPVLTRHDLSAAGITARTVPYPLLLGAAGLGWRMGLQPLHPGWLRLADRAPLMDTERARRCLGWVPRVGAAEALRETIDAMRSAHAGDSPPLAPWGTRPGPPGRQAVHLGRPLRQSQR